MRRFGKSCWLFGRALLPSIAAFAAAIDDPMHWLKALGLVNAESSDLIISPAWRQTLFFSVGFVCLLLWYHRQRVAFEDRQPAKGDMPLHVALRYLLGSSQWAVHQPNYDAEAAAMMAGRELFSKLSAGDLQAFGRRRDGGKKTELGQKPIPAEAFNDPQWKPAFLFIGPEPPTAITGGIGDPMFFKVHLNREQVLSVWPKRTLWQRIQGRKTILTSLKSKVSGGSLEEIFERQDRNYADSHGLAIVAEFTGALP